MDFTREPIIETIITPKEGYKLVIRSSKSIGQEEYFVDAVEIVAFGHALFFRSLERPKSFLVPVVDYEVVEVREARMVLKNVGIDRSIKIGGGREGTLKATKEVEKSEAILTEEGEAASEQEEASPQVAEPATAEARPEVRLDKKRDRRRHYRKRRGGREEREEAPKEEETAVPNLPPLEDEKVNIPAPEAGAEAAAEGSSALSSSLLSSLLQPPPTLISETINRYRENALFKNAFFLTEEEHYKPHDKVQELLNENDDEDFAPSLQEPTYVSEEAVKSEEPSKSAIESQEQEQSAIQEEASDSEQTDAHFLSGQEEFPIEREEAEEDIKEADKELSENVPFEQPEEDSEASLPLYAEEDEKVAEQTFKEEKFEQNEFIAPEKEKASNNHKHGDEAF
ncbi:hypothetical protein [Candidatus Protochlamydia phocaeensis]|uniref:hypothetical protein n=1 Tax=Candidatus Protochlamydia phocaeensis TaxID=1414722 RepID=UPI0008393B8B|nr:hypothetical protein [Candidatus Protochlamydia phocaeensis]